MRAPFVRVGVGAVPDTAVLSLLLSGVMLPSASVSRLTTAEHHPVRFGPMMAGREKGQECGVRSGAKCRI